MKFKKVPIEILAYLLRARYKLELLEEAGVDNWEYYFEVLHPKGDDPMSFKEYSDLSNEELTLNYEDI